ncbi:MAG: CopG family ribbon-helix-helix protein [Bryobacteraceae bacterium]
MSLGKSSRVYTVTLPEELAEQVDRLAKEESRDINELMREAFRYYCAERARRLLRSDVEYAATLRTPYTANDVESLVDDVRAEASRLKHVTRDRRP